jgi:hypothetical protein
MENAAATMWLINRGDEKCCGSQVDPRGDD